MPQGDVDSLNLTCNDNGRSVKFCLWITCLLVYTSSIYVWHVTTPHELTGATMSTCRSVVVHPMLRYQNHLTLIRLTLKSSSSATGDASICNSTKPSPARKLKMCPSGDYHVGENHPTSCDIRITYRVVTLSAHWGDSWQETGEWPEDNFSPEPKDK